MRLLIIISILIVAGSLLTTLFGYFAAREALRTSIARYELPSASDLINTRIQKDLIRPLFVSSMMANDTFLHSWVLRGETDIAEIAEYLHEVRQRYGAFTAFFVSDISRNYYYADGVLKKVRESEPRDIWYFRVSKMEPDYELNVDQDMAHNDELTIFINYRVLNREGRYLGAAGIGINVSSISKVVENFKDDYAVTVYFTQTDGTFIAGQPYATAPGYAANLKNDPSLRKILPRAMQLEGKRNFEYRRDGSIMLMNVRYIPELKWYLFVEKPQNDLIEGPRKAVVINMAVYTSILILILIATILTINHFQSRLEYSALHDTLTNLLNRNALENSSKLLLSQGARFGNPLCLIMLDIDNFKQINDSFGHQAGDSVLVTFAETLRQAVRKNDIICRWGGEEFLLLLPGCPREKAIENTENILTAIRNTKSICPLSASAGIAIRNENETMEALIKRADAELIRAKQLGKDRVCIAG